MTNDAKRRQTMLNDAKRGPVVVAYVAHVAGWTVPQVPHWRLPAGALAPPNFPLRETAPLRQKAAEACQHGFRIG